ncbi:hypothetical protein HanPI659440_Chr13g0511161 [Helianthus annuus]|nr:hypothetical protein HanPI659440_Chr13g0511161 [Helianthus annuus]
MHEWCASRHWQGKSGMPQPSCYWDSWIHHNNRRFRLYLLKNEKEGINTSNRHY